MAVCQAIQAGKAIYCEKPTANTLAGALALYREAVCQAYRNRMHDLRHYTGQRTDIQPQDARSYFEPE